MKYLGLILATLALVAGQILAFGINENDSQLQRSLQRSYDDKLRNFLEKFKTTLREGNETLGIPKMDPYYNENLPYEFAEPEITGNVVLRELNIEGLAGYKVETAKLSVLLRKLTVGLMWPQIESDAKYVLNVTLMNKINAFGDGTFKVKVSDLFFETTIKLSISGGFKVKEMVSKIVLGDVKLNVTGLWNDKKLSELASDVISDVGPQLVQDLQSELTGTLNKKMTAIIDKQLEGKTISDLISMFG